MILYYLTRPRDRGIVYIPAGVLWHTKLSLNNKNGYMNTISEEELLALQAAHIEVENSQWLKLKTRILTRALLVLVLILTRALILHLFPQTYVALIFDSSEVGSAELQSLIFTRLLFGALLGSVYIYALMTNRYLRSVSVLALMIPVMLLWADFQMFFVSSFPDFTLTTSISFGLRLMAIYLLAKNYIDVRR